MGNGLIDVDPAQWVIALERERVLRPLLSQGHAPSGVDIRDAARRLGLSPRWARTLLQRFRADPRTSVLLHDPGGRRKGHSALDPRVAALISAQIEGYFASPQRPRQKDLFETIRRAARAAGLPPPAPETVRRRLKAADQVKLATRREGRDKARRFAAAREPFDPATRPLQLVEIDHTRVDVIVVDEVQRLPIGRPWLTLAIDLFSRMVVGLHITLEAPSALSVALCLASVVTPKAAWLAKLGVEADWPAAGIPDAIHLDNAPEFRSEALVRGCEEHGTIINYRPVATPHYGGHIESLIGTTMGKVHLLPGTTFSNARERGDYDSEGRALLTLAELETWLAREVGVMYHGVVHRTLGRPPLAIWREAVANGFVPRIASDPEQIRRDFLPLVRRAARRDGVRLFSIGYWHDLLPTLAARGAPKLIVRYDPRDLSRIWAGVPGEPGYFELRYKDLRRPPITLWQHMAALRLLHERGRREVDEGALFAAVEEQERLVAEAAERTKSARRMRARTDYARSTIRPTQSARKEGPENLDIDYSRPPKTYIAEEWS